MKKHVSSIVFGCVGLCAGFTFCFVYLVIPERGSSEVQAPGRSELLALRRAALDSHSVWYPYLGELLEQLSRSGRTPFASFGSLGPVSTNHGISEIGIERRGYLESYTFIVKRDGTFRYHGSGAARHSGKYSGVIRPAASFHHAANLIAQAGYLNPNESYPFPISHGGSAYIMIVINGRTNVVKNRTASGSSKLWAVERLIDSLMADVERWQKEK